MSEMAIGQLGMRDHAATVARDLSASAGAAPFAQTLEGAVERRGATGARTTQDETYRKVHEAAEELVGGAFVRPVLAQLRDTSQAAPPFAPGLWEKTFGPMMDAEVSQRIMRSARFPLVDTLTEQLMSRVRRTGAPVATPGKEIANG